MVPGLDGAVVHVELGHVGKAAGVVDLVHDLHAVESVHDLDQAEGGAHLVLVLDDTAGSADDPAEYGFLEKVEARARAEDLLLEIVDVPLKCLEANRGGAAVAGRGRRIRRGRRG